jgi:hypothetical protein
MLFSLGNVGHAGDVVIDDSGLFHDAVEDVCVSIVTKCDLMKSFMPFAS